MLLVHDLDKAVASLEAHTMDCPTRGCGGWLGPWGYTTRRVRIALDHSELRRQRRGYCRSCHRSHVLSDLGTYPYRLDTSATFTAALVAAAGGLGYRRVAAEIDRPVSTVRDWLRRARINAETVRGTAMRALHRFDPSAGPVMPAGSVLGDMVNAVGVATAAWVRGRGPVSHGHQVAAFITAGAVLAVRPTPWW